LALEAWEVYTAWDNEDDERTFFRGLDRLKAHGICAQLALRSHAQPGGLWQVRRRWMQLLPHALPLVQTRQQVCGSSAGLVGFAGSGRCSGGGSLRAGFSGFCCAIASTAGAAASVSTTSNTYRILLTISGRYPRRSVGGSDFTARRCWAGDRRVSLPLFGGDAS
jgi:hypothetical protein